MADFKIPKLNKNSGKFFFKKKLSLRRKSKRKLIRESFTMLFISNLIFYFNYLIPNKRFIFNNLLNNFQKLSGNILTSLSYFYEICLVVLIVLSLILAFILMLGSLSRLIKILKRKSTQITFK